MTLPFSIFKRSRSDVFYVRFKDSTTGKYLSERSTGKTSRDEAIQEAFRMMSDVSEIKKTEKQKKKILIRNAELDESDLMFALEEMKRRGLISSVTLTNEKNSRKVVDYLEEFWDWEKSPYIKEKLRQGHSIHKNHTVNMQKFVGKYWKSYFDKMTLGEVTKDIVRGMFDEISKYNVSGHTKNTAIRSVTTPLKYAFNHEIITTDLTSGLVWFSESYAERMILTPEIAQAIFSIEWKSQKAKLGNLVAMLTGMRIGEIRALKVKDLGKDCLYVNHSWNDREGLKAPKNGESRIVQFPFPSLINEMIGLAKSSPVYRGIDDFIFWGLKINQPIDTDIFIEGLRDSLVKIGMSEEESKKYVFHSWRHFFATYLSEKLDTKLLQQQTGHKTRAMLEHYANHRTINDAMTVQNAQIEVFKNIVPVLTISEN